MNFNLAHFHWFVKSDMYIYRLYITSPGLPITRGIPGQTVPSGRAGPGPGVYKRRPKRQGSIFYVPWSMSDGAHSGACDGGSCPRARATTDPWPVAVAPRPKRAVAAVPRSGVAAAIPRSVTWWWRLLDSEGKRRRGHVRASCGVPGAPRRVRGGGTPKAGEQAAPPNVREATVPHEARGSSGVMEGARCMQQWSRVTSSDPTQFGRPEWRPPSILVLSTTSSGNYLLRFVLSFDYCVLCLPHALFTLKLYDFMLKHGVRILVYCMHILCMHIEKGIPWFMLFIITIKIKSFMFVPARFLRLP
jgi:hypothetical protein